MSCCYGNGEALRFSTITKVWNNSGCHLMPDMSTCMNTQPQTHMCRQKTPTPKCCWLRCKRKMLLVVTTCLGLNLLLHKQWAFLMSDQVFLIAEPSNLEETCSDSRYTRHNPDSSRESCGSCFISLPAVPH